MTEPRRVAKVRIYGTIEEFEKKLNQNLRDGWDLHSWTCEPLDQKRGESYQLYLVVYTRAVLGDSAVAPSEALMDLHEAREAIRLALGDGEESTLFALGEHHVQCLEMETSNIDGKARAIRDSAIDIEVKLRRALGES